PTCRDVVLLRNVVENSVFDLTLRCAGCRTDCNTPEFPAGRGLPAMHGLISIVQLGEFAATSSKALVHDEIVIGAAGVMRRRIETGHFGERATQPPPSYELDEGRIDQLLADARAAFRSILPEIEAAFARGATRHNLPRLLRTVEAN